MGFNSKYKSSKIEELLDQVANGEIGGGIETETDPIFSASPAATITNEDKASWSGKQDAIDDLATIRDNANKGASALSMAEDINDLVNALDEDVSKLYANKVDKVSGKQLSTEDFTTALKSKLEGLSNYDDTELSNALSTLRGDFDKLVSGDTTTAIKTFNEVIAFLDGIQDSQDLSSIISSIEQQIAGKQDFISDLDAIRSGAEKGATALQSVPSEYVKQGQLDEVSSAVGGLNENIDLLYQNKQNNITDLETIREGASKGATAVQPSDIPEETYLADFTMTSLRQGMNSGHQVDCDMNSLIEAMAANKTILVREEEDGYKGVYVLNGYAEDLLYFSIVDTAGDVLYCEGTDYTNSNYIDGRTLLVRRWDDKQDILVSGENIKTINGESILGEGNIIIAGGSGEKGDKGDKGDTGVGVQSVAQTTTSNADGGSNIVTVTLTDGTKSTFTVKNGSKGSQGIQGIQGEQGPKGDKGDKGDTGTAGANGTNGKDGADGKDGVTFTPSVDSAGNLSWTNNGGLTNPPTVNIKGPKGDKGDSGSGGGGSSSGSGKEYIVVEPDFSPAGLEAYIRNIMPNTTYIVSDNVSLLHISEFSVSDALSDEYNVIFKADMGGTTLSINSYNSIYWANGVIPTIEGGAVYELSIQRVSLGSTDFFNTVLTPFKLIE